MQASAIIRAFDGRNIRQRETDGYLSATDMCQIFGKKINHYTANDSTKEYISALSADAGLSVSELIEIRKGGDPQKQGTWVHPLVATHLAQWLSSKFAIQVSKWVARYLSGDLTLIREVADRHDRVHNTDTTVSIKVTELNNDERKLSLRERELAIRREEFELEERKKASELALRERESAMREREKAITFNLMDRLDKMKVDPHLYSAVKNSIINSLDQNTITNGEEEDYTKSRDISELIRSIGRSIPNNKVLAKIGKEISTEYHRRYPDTPILKANKHVNGSIRQVNVYLRKDEEWILPIISRHV